MSTPLQTVVSFGVGLVMICIGIQIIRACGLVIHKMAEMLRALSRRAGAVYWQSEPRFKMVQSEHGSWHLYRWRLIYWQFLTVRTGIDRAVEFVKKDGAA